MISNGFANTNSRDNANVGTERLAGKKTALTWLLLCAFNIVFISASEAAESPAVMPSPSAVPATTMPLQHGSGERHEGIKLKKGAKLYVDNCAICHGDNGNADTRAAGSLNPPPRNFTTIQSAMELTRERMIASVTNGRPGTAMMAHKDRLSSEEIEEVVDFIRDNFMRSPQQAQIPKKLLPGQKIYRANCAVCHGDKGNTALWARSGLNPPPRDFTSVRARKELTRSRMIHSVTHGRPGTGMMPFKSKLSNSEIEQVVDFIRATFIRPDQPHAGTAMNAQVPSDSLHSGMAQSEPIAAAGGGNAGAANPHGGGHPGMPMGMLPGTNTMPLSPPGFESMAAADMSKPMPLSLKGDVAAGRAFFMNNCFICHGVTGEGNGPRADFNIPRPRNFTSKESRRLFNRERLFTSISNGKVGTVMPAWSRVLTPQQIANVAEFVFQAFILGKGAEVKAQSDSNKKKTLVHDTSSAKAPSPAATTSTSGLTPRLQKGRDIYNYRCYFCHGYSGDGKTLAATFLDPKPRNFIATDLSSLSRQAMIKAVSEGKPGTAMKSFARSLSREEIALVVDYVRENFIRNKAANSVYHSAENGWTSMQAYADAFPFARDEIPLDTPESQLSAQQLRGKFIFMNSCVSCHDRTRGDRSNQQSGDKGAASWEPDAVSYPRNAFTPQQLEQQMSLSFNNNDSANSDKSGADSTSGASPYARHDQAPRLSGLSENERAGEALFQNNCAFCHAADGSGKNWIGSFLKPHPRNLSNRAFMATMSRSHLRQVIKEGIPGTTMSSWKNVLNAQQIEQIIDYLARAFGPLSSPTTSH